ncbi:hypothetical protein [uncultured Oxalicibacterium sp.]|uniref:hypothetical protein n=1 Tax=uncultured Oxalicibacterium sp. TaxID=1168540 RepID=UPI0025E3D293|nr:hypothetical protein [uncultured Oxalicibacterium sp.]
MSYLEIVKLALKGRTVNAAAKQWGMHQQTLEKYAKGTRLPDYLTAKKMAVEAGISAGEMLDVLAAEEAKRKGKIEKISESFKRLLRMAKLDGKPLSA